MLEIDIKKHLGKFNLEAAFKTDSKGVTAIFGASGAGKTTIINMISGLISPDSGYIKFNDQIFFDSDKKINIPVNKRSVGYIFQDGRLFPNMTVMKNLLYGAKRKSDKGAICTIDGVCELLGIKNLLDRYPKMLSGGEKQRVAIGRALLSNPEILLMDEPLAALDRSRKHELLEYLGLIRNRFDIPILYVTHSYEEIIRLADNIAVIEDGRLAYFGNAIEILNKMNYKNHNETKVFGTVCEGEISSYNRDTEIAIIDFGGGVAEVSSSDIPVGSQVRFRINAMDVVICASKPPVTSVRNTYSGKVIEITENENHFADILIDIGIPLWARISGQSLRELDIQVGKETYALVKSAVISNNMNILS